MRSGIERRLHRVTPTASTSSANYDVTQGRFLCFGLQFFNGAVCEAFELLNCRANIVLQEVGVVRP